MNILFVIIKSLITFAVSSLNILSPTTLDKKDNCIILAEML